MNFIKFVQTHYEKIILAGLLILFSLLLVGQLMVIQKNQNQKVDEIIQEEDPPADFPRFDYDKDESYKASNIFTAGDKWIARKKEDGSRVDMMTPGKLAICPHCFYFIPAESFPAKGDTTPGKCPRKMCAMELAARTSDKEQADEAVVDLVDEFGIKDSWKVANGFDLKVDVNSDPDGDSFSILDEFNAGTNPADADSHPRFVLKLAARDFIYQAFEEILPDDVKAKFKGGKVKFLGLNGDSADFAFVMNNGESRRTLFSNGDKLELRYKPQGSGWQKINSGFVVRIAKDENNKSVVTLVSSENPSLVVTCKRDSYLSSPRVTAVLTADASLKIAKDIKLNKGSKLVLGKTLGAEMKPEEYLVADITADKKVIFKMVGTGNEYAVSAGGCVALTESEPAEAVKPAEAAKPAEAPKK